MAHLAKFEKGAFGRLYDHWTRATDTTGQYITYRTETETGGHIDRARTSQNYSIGSIHDKKWVAARLRGVYQKPGQKHPPHTCDIVVTLPQSESKEIENVRHFMQAAYDSLLQMYGQRNNIIGAWVHLDEAQPHIHFAFLPISERTSKQKPDFKEKLSTRAYWPRKSSLQEMHQRLQKDISSALGHPVEITNGVVKAQGGNKSIVSLKTEARKAQEYIETYHATKASELNDLTGVYKKPLLGTEHYELTPHQYKRLRTLVSVGLAQQTEYERMTKENIQLKSENETFRRRMQRYALKNEEDVRAKYTDAIDSIKRENAELKAENAFLGKLAAPLRDVPEGFQNYILDEITQTVENIRRDWNGACRAVLRAAARLARWSGNIDRAAAQLSEPLSCVCIPVDQQARVCKECVAALRAQERGRHPDTPKATWGIPSPSEIDYSQACAADTEAMLRVLPDAACHAVLNADRDANIAQERAAMRATDKRSKRSGWSR